jgi:nicotinamide mononucleotide transporter
MIRKYFEKWNWFELAFLCGAFVVPITFGIIFKNPVLEILTTMVSLVVSILFAKAKIEAYFLCLVSLALYMFVTFSAKLYGEVIVTVVLSYPVTIFGVVNWFRNKYNHSKKGQVVKIVRIRKLEIAFVILSQAVLYYGYVLFLDLFGTRFVFVSALSICSSVFASYLVARRSSLGLLGWLLNDFVLLALLFLAVGDGSRNLIPLVVMTFMNILNDSYGLFNWRILKRHQDEKSVAEPQTRSVS